MIWRDEALKEFKKMYEGGEPAEEIANHFGVSLSAVYRAANTYGIARRKQLKAAGSKKPRKAYTDEDMARVFGLKKEGKKDREIAELLGIPYGSIRRLYEEGEALDWWSEFGAEWQETCALVRKGLGA